MIKINLLGDDTAIDYSHYFWIGGYVSSLAIFIGAFFLVYSAVKSDIDDLTTEVAELDKQLVRLQEETKEIKALDKKKQDLNNKLAVIAKLKRSKLGPVRVLDDLNLAIPERSWLLEIKETGGVFRIVGHAIDNQTIANFMKELESSDYFETVDLIETKQVVTRQVKMSKFTLQTQVNYAGKIVVASDEEEEAEGGGNA